jgi:alkanesulfonate monooxygenase SsuD/methylene tetrahydromethanopterin reductase-like flavin-dependent oxidoreductase (luciferase family)
MPHNPVGYKREPTRRRRTLTAQRSTATVGGPAIGVFLPTMAERGEALPDVVAAARHAEDLGFESAWAVDQLVAGTGVPLLESTVALAAAAGATTRLRLAYGVLIVPLRPVVWIAKEVAALQHVSGDRLLLGVGVGGDRHDRSWAAAGVPRTERGRRLDAALRVLPDLIAGKEVDVPGGPVQLAPGATVPPIVVGGLADAALARAARVGDGWFAMPLPPALLAPTVERLGALAAAASRPRPAITGSVTVALAGDPARPAPDVLVQLLTDPDGRYGMPADAVAGMLVTDGGAAAERVAGLAALGAERVVLTLAAGDWFRQAELAAEALGLGGRHRETTG